MPICSEVVPPAYEVEPGHRTRCHLYEGSPIVEDESNTESTDAQLVREREARLGTA